MLFYVCHDMTSDSFPASHTKIYAFYEPQQSLWHDIPKQKLLYGCGGAEDLHNFLDSLICVHLRI